ncbi:hypothetical protein C8R43DRAFT_502525 [Mycena crocata]|nr:hypothetical protein C8R43DRAFT_502525 [Mycena crocata]
MSRPRTKKDRDKGKEKEKDRDRHLMALVAEKDQEQIANLQISLEAHVARALSTSSRLKLAWDALDELQAKHTLELSKEVSDKERLRTTLSRYLDVVRDAEIERDNLRDAVNELVERVEISKADFTAWSHSRMRLPRLSEPIHPLPSDPSNIASEDNLWAYAAGMITYLRAAWATERRAHAETRSGARVRIALLEAQVRRCEAELEACAVHACGWRTDAGQTFPHASTSASPRTGRHQDLPALPPSPPALLLSSDEMHAFLERTEAQNGLLEDEAGRLAVKLEQARIAARRRAHLREPAIGEQNEEQNVAGPSSRPQNNALRIQDRVRRQISPRDDNRQHSPPLHSRGSTSPPRDCPPSPVLEAVDPDRTIRPRPSLRTRTGDLREETSGTDPIHIALDREIAMLGAKIENFHLERERLLAVVREEAAVVEEESERTARAVEVVEERAAEVPSNSQLDRPGDGLPRPGENQASRRREREERVGSGRRHQQQGRPVSTRVPIIGVSGSVFHHSLFFNHSIFDFDISTLPSWVASFLYHSSMLHIT